ncbi:MAG: twin transmembrane helix small protein [Woeseia sp.]
MKYLLIAVLAAIVLSLASGLYFRGKDDRDSPRVVKALWVRVGLSALLLVLLLLSWFMGWLAPR